LSSSPSQRVNNNNNNNNKVNNKGNNNQLKHNSSSESTRLFQRNLDRRQTPFANDRNGMPRKWKR